MTRNLVHRQRRVLFIGHAAARCRELLPRLTADEQLTFEIAESGAAGLAMASNAMPQYDAILIAVDLPDADGPLLCAKLRERGMNIPMLLLADHSNEAAVIRGLDLGANDFICAPFRLAEFVARLRAQIRAYESSEDAVLSIGPFQFRPARRMLQHSQTSERVRLTEKEAAVLKFLYRAAGPVPRNTLLHEVWGYNAKATTHTVETHIYRLRRKIEPDPNRILLLVNEEGGYRLCVQAPVPLMEKYQPRMMMTHAA